MRFIDALKSYAHSLKQNANSYLLKCPLCGGIDKFYIRKSDGTYTCFKCHERISRIELLCYISGEPYEHIKNLFRNLRNYNTEISDLDLIEEEIVEKKILPTIKFPSEFRFCEGEDEGSLYASKRGIPLSVLNYYGCLYNPNSYRLITPVTHEFNLVGYQGRDVTGMSPLKAMTSKFSKDLCLMGLDLVEGDKVFLVEGPFDMFALRRAGYEAVCLMGSSISEEQIKLLKMRNFKEIVIALDADAVEKAYKIQYKLFKHSQIKIPLRGNKDFGEMSDNEIREILEEDIFFDPLPNI